MKGTKTMRVRGEYLESLDDAVTEWLRSGPQQRPEITENGVKAEDAASFQLSVVGTLLLVAARMSQMFSRFGIEMTEEQFVQAARNRFRDFMAQGDA
jgi:hypothetical protein